MLTIIDLTEIEKADINQLLMWKKSVLEMFAKCIEKDNTGAAAVMNRIKYLINEEIMKRNENEDLDIPTNT